MHMINLYNLFVPIENIRFVCVTHDVNEQYCLGHCSMMMMMMASARDA